MMVNKTFSASLVTILSLFVGYTAATCTRQYVVKEGDYCDLISASQNVSTYQLAAVNPSINSGCTNLLPGQTLCLGTQGEDCSSTYIVQPDDTCDLVSQKTGVNSTILSLNNPQIDQECSNIYIGEVLCIAGVVQVPPAPADKPSSALHGASIPTTATAAHVAPATPQPTPPPAGDGNHNQDNGEEGDDENLPYCDEL